MNEDHYKLLGLQRDASLEEIKRAYRQLAKRYHPDRTQNNAQDTEIFKAVSAAFATLSNPERRAEYDRLLDASEHRTVFLIGGGGPRPVSRYRGQSPLCGDFMEVFSRGGGGGAL